MRFHAIEIVNPGLRIVHVAKQGRAFDRTLNALQKLIKDADTYTIGTVDAVDSDEAIRLVCDGKWQYTQKV